MVFQHFSLFETLTVAENVALALAEQPSLGRAVASASREVSAQLRPAGRSARGSVHTLSVGERQRVEIVRCLLQNPRLLIMDEPTSVLTPQAVRKAVRDAAPARGRRLQHPLHQPQARRDPRAVPHAHRAARRQGHRHVRSAQREQRRRWRG